MNQQQAKDLKTMLDGVAASKATRRSLSKPDQYRSLIKSLFNQRDYAVKYYPELVPGVTAMIGDMQHGLDLTLKGLMT